MLSVLLLVSSLLAQGPTSPRTGQMQPTRATAIPSILVFLPGVSPGFLLATLDASLTIDLSNPKSPVLKAVPAGTPTQVTVHMDAEVPVGVTDGVNTTFTLVKAPSPPASLTLFRNGILQKAGFDYVLNGSTINFCTLCVPQGQSTGNDVDTLMAWYRTTP